MFGSIPPPAFTKRRARRWGHALRPRARLQSTWSPSRWRSRAEARLDAVKGGIEPNPGPSNNLVVKQLGKPQRRERTAESEDPAPCFPVNGWVPVLAVSQLRQLVDGSVVRFSHTSGSVEHGFVKSGRIYLSTLRDWFELSFDGEQWLCRGSESAMVANNPEVHDAIDGVSMEPDEPSDASDDEPDQTPSLGDVICFRLFLQSDPPKLVAHVGFAHIVHTSKDHLYVRVYQVNLRPAAVEANLASLFIAREQAVCPLNAGVRGPPVHYDSRLWRFDPDPDTDSSHCLRAKQGGALPWWLN